ncbi:MAG: PAS domain S-box protein [Deltaproteobacteria bacterium]|nr:PAS domain S-box protein [Deltaproteobacteria bacterium]
MDNPKSILKSGIFTTGGNPEILLGIAALGGLYLISLHDYLLFDVLAELFSITIGLTLFVLVWNLRRRITNQYLLFIGIACLFTAILDTIHILSFQGMTGFSIDDPNTAAQLWIAARFIQALALLGAPYFLKRKLNSETAFLFFSIAIIPILSAIFIWKSFPTFYAAGMGFTPAKMAGELVIAAIAFAALLLLFKNRSHFDPLVFRWISASIIATIGSELAFAVEGYAMANLTGHFLKAGAFYLLYKAIIESAFLKPQKLLFEDLVRQQEALQEEKQRTQNYLDVAGVIVVLNADQTIALVNKAGYSTLNYEEQDLLGKNWFDTLVPERLREEARAAFTRLVAGDLRDANADEGPLLTASGEERWFLWRNSLLKDDSGRVTGTLRSGEDITERKGAEEKLLAIQEELEVRVQERTAQLDRTNWQLTCEIEARKKIQEDLAEQSRILEAFFNHSLTPTVFLDRDFNFIRVNEAYAQACRRDTRAFPGHNHFQLYPSALEALFRQVVETKKPFQALASPFGYPAHPEGGTSFWDWTLVPIPDESGEIDFLVFSLNDVTKRKLAEEEVKKHAQLLDLANDTILVCDLNGNVLYWNKGAETLYGWPGEEASGRNIRTLFQPDFAEHFQEAEAMFFRDGYWEEETNHRKKDGTQVMVQSRWTLQRDDRGVPVAFSEINRDITELKRKEKELQDSSIYSRTLIEASLDPLVTINAGGKIMDVSRATELVTGVSRERLVGSDFSEYFTEPEKAREGYKMVFSRGFVRDYPLAIRNNSGQATEVLYNATLYRDEEGEVQGVFAAARDVTELRAAQRALQKSHADLERRVEERTAELEDAIKELESFSYSVSHDLQTPLRAIDGYARMILKNHGALFDDDARQKFNTIRNNAQMMGRLIEELLAFSRLGRKEITPSKLDMNGLVADAWKELREIEPERQISLTVRNIPMAYGDRTLIKQVILNLLSNASKFTKHHNCATIEAGGYVDGQCLVYYVKDNGIGFDMAYHDKMFGVFQRLHHNNDAFEGTGVGLAIVQRIIHRHGGRVWAKGTPDRGATFYFSLRREESHWNGAI